MGFLAGRVSFLRYRVDGAVPTIFGPDHLKKLSKRAIGTQRSEDKDGIEAGWTAGDHILDLDFDLAKNIVNDALCFSLRVDTPRLPADLLRAYTRVELKALAAGNPSGFPSKKQKKEARESARERLEAEGSDGRFIRRKAYSILWDRPNNSLLIAATAGSILDRVLRLFKDTFGHDLTLLDAGQCAARGQYGHAPEDARPAVFVPSGGEPEVAWVKDPAARSFLGNEFLLWLWFVLDEDGDSLKLADNSTVTAMFARTLMLDCPRGQSGNETIRSESPVQLPEARRAIQAGKLPRQVGLILVRHEQQYELTLRAETLAVSGAKLPREEEAEPRVEWENRVDHVRRLNETLDLLYDAFLRRRLAPSWAKELKRLRLWLQRDEREANAAAG